MFNSCGDWKLNQKMFNSCLYGDYYEGHDWRIPSSNFILPQPIVRLPVLNYMCMVLLNWNKYGYFPSNSALSISWQTESRKKGRILQHSTVLLSDRTMRGRAFQLNRSVSRHAVRPTGGSSSATLGNSKIRRPSKAPSARPLGNSTTLGSTRRSSRTEWMNPLTVSGKWKWAKKLPWIRPCPRIATTTDQESTSNIGQGRRVISRGQVCPGSLMWLYNKQT